MERPVRSRLAALLQERLTDEEAALHPAMQAPAVIEYPGCGARKLLLCGIEGAEANLQALARAAATAGGLTGGGGGLEVVAHVNCLGRAAMDACRAEYARARLTHVLPLEAKDEEGHAMIPRHLSTFLDFVRSAPECAVLVHCFEGRNRSATLCVAWLVVEGRLPLTDALRRVFERRPIVLTNRSFLEQLIDLAKEHNLFR